jgi:membrane dipeptidase
MSTASFAPSKAHPVADLHCDTVMEIQAGVRLGAGNPLGHVDVPRMRAGGVGLQVFAAFVAQVTPFELAFRRAQEMLDAVESSVTQEGGALVLVHDKADLDRAQKEGRPGVMLAVENGHAIQKSLSKLIALHERGVRYLTLTHSGSLDWAGSSGDDSGRGLDDFGRKVVACMEEIGMLVDVSHVNEATFWDVARIARKPFIASHSNASALCPVARNLTDDQLRAVAASGGMVGINFFPGFLDPEHAALLEERVGDLFALYSTIEAGHEADPVARMEASREVTRTYQARMADSRVPLARVCEHIEHVTALVGDEAVGFGSDFDGVPDLPEGVTGCDVFPAILRMLEARGMPGRSLERIAWGNFERVFFEAR